MKLTTSKEMRDLDTSAIEDFCIPGIVLMENAGLGTVRMIEQQCGPCENTIAPIFVGPGNNGGDGLVIGRHLHQRGCHPIFFFLVNPNNLKGDAAVNFKIIQKLNLPFHLIDNLRQVKTISVLSKQHEIKWGPCYIIVDAIFGIGLGRKVSKHFAETIKLINNKVFAHKVPVISVDVPSGLDSDTGKILGSCVKADFTATYCCAKRGQFIQEGSSLTGKLEVIDIGIPEDVVRKSQIATELSTQECFRRLAAGLDRSRDSHKGNHGHLQVIGGSPGKTGAAVLAAKGALRSGAGLVSLFAPRNLNSIFETSLLEAMTIPLASSSDIFKIDDIDFILDGIVDKQALVIGPGIGVNESTRQLVIRLYHEVKCPLVIDADALNLLALSPKEINIPAGPRIFTPHPGELGRLIARSPKDIQSDRLDAAHTGCRLFKRSDQDIILILKGADTLIVDNNGSVTINSTGNPGMAAGGMGDVLSGMIGAFLCQGMSPRNAAIAGVFLHGKAGDELYMKIGLGYTAGELTDRIPVTLKNLIQI